MREKITTARKKLKKEPEPMIRARFHIGATAVFFLHFFFGIFPDEFNEPPQRKNRNLVLGFSKFSSN
jgi:hypothetical protein